MDQNDKLTLANGNEVLLGLNIYNNWTVSCWNTDMECLSQQVFENYEDAKKSFNTWKTSN